MGQRPLRTDDLGPRKAEAGDPEDEFPVKKKTKEKGAGVRRRLYSVP